MGFASSWHPASRSTIHTGNLVILAIPRSPLNKATERGVPVSTDAPDVIWGGCRKTLAAAIYAGFQRRGATRPPGAVVIVTAGYRVLAAPSKPSRPWRASRSPGRRPRPAHR